MAASAQGIRAGAAYVELGTKDAALVKGLKRAEARVRAWGQSMAAIGQKMALAGVGAAAGLGLATRTFATFESAMARTRGLLQLEKTSAAFGMLEQEAMRLGATTTFTAAQAAAGMALFAQSGLDAQQIMKAVGPALQLAVVGNMELARAVEISTGVMHGFGLQAAELPMIANVLAKASIASAATVESLGEAFSYASANASTLGVDIHDVAAMVEILSNANVKGDRAGTGLMSVMASMTDLTAEAVEEFGRLGVETADAAGNFRGFAAVVGDLKAALSGMGGAAQLASLNKIFTIRGSNVASILTRAGPEEIRRRSAASASAHGENVAGGIEAAQLDTLYGSWMLLWSAIDGVSISIGKSLAPVLREWGAGLAYVAEVAKALSDRNPELWRGLLVGTVVVGGLGVAFVGLGMVATGVAATLGGLAAAAGLIGTAVGFLVSPLGAGTVALGALAARTDAGSEAVVKLGEGFSWLGGVVGKTWGGVLDAIKAGDMGLALKVAGKGLQAAWVGIVNGMQDVWDGFTGHLRDSLRPVTDGWNQRGSRVWADFESLGIEAKHWFMGLMPESPNDRRQRLAQRDQEHADVHVGMNRAVNLADEADRAANAARLAAIARVREERAAALARAEADLAAALAEAAAAMEDARLARLPALADSIMQAGQAAVNAAGGRVMPTGEQVLAAMSQASGRGGSAGTFNAGAIRGLAGRNTELEKLVELNKAAEKKRERMERLLDRIERNTGENLRFV